MNRRSLKDLVRQVLFGGIAASSAANVLPAMAAPDTPISPFEPEPHASRIGSSQRELILRKARPKVLLKALDATRVALVSSHRSHRSHSSHYSSRGSVSPPAPRPRDTTRSTRPSVPRTVDPSTVQRPLLGTATPPESTALGSRVLHGNVWSRCRSTDHSSG